MWSPASWTLREPSAGMLLHADGFLPAWKKDLFYSSLSAPRSIRPKPAETNPPAWPQDGGFLPITQEGTTQTLLYMMKTSTTAGIALIWKSLLDPLEFCRFLAFHDIQTVHQVAYFP